MRNGLLSTLVVAVAACGGGSTNVSPPPPVETSGPPPSSQNAMQRLAELVAEESEGWSTVGDATREGLAAHQTVVRPVSMSAGTCYRVLAAGEGGVRDIALVLRAPGGDAVQSDQRQDRYASLGVAQPLCPEEGGDFELEIGMPSGAGGVAWQLLAQADKSGGGNGDSHRVGGDGDSHRVGGDGDDFIAEQIRARHLHVGAGMAPVTDVVRAELQTSEEHELELSVRGGHCYVVIAVGVPSVRRAELTVRDPFGNERASRGADDSFPSVRACADVDGRWTAVVRAFQGYGDVGIQAFGAEQ